MHFKQAVVDVHREEFDDFLLGKRKPSFPFLINFFQVIFLITYAVSIALLFQIKLRTVIFVCNNIFPALYHKLTVRQFGHFYPFAAMAFLDCDVARQFGKIIFHLLRSAHLLIDQNKQVVRGQPMTVLQLKDLIGVDESVEGDCGCRINLKLLLNCDAVTLYPDKQEQAYKPSFDRI